MYRLLVISFLVILMAVPSTFADRRKYVWTYQYGTIAPDASELEFYQTTRIDQIDFWEYRIEIEHGISPKMDFSVYQIFAQTEGSSLRWDAVQLRGRCRLAEPGRFLLDPLFYLEYNRNIDLSEPNKLEGKLILSRDFQKVNLALNPVYEIAWAPGEPEHEFGFDAGLSYEFTYKLSVGIESTSRYELVDEGENEFGSYFGPTVSLATGTAYYTVGYTWGLTDDSNDARVRFLMGVSL